MNSDDLKIDNRWTLFLDRDGVINRRIVDGYVRQFSEFEFLPGVLEALTTLSHLFSRIIVVSNQQGVGKGLMTAEEVNNIHELMVQFIIRAGGKIDKVYFCPALKSANSFYRKPNIGMALKAKKEYPNIAFRKSIMVGDSISDMKFGKRCKMKTALITNDLQLVRQHSQLIDYSFSDLLSFSKFIIHSTTPHADIPLYNSEVH